MDKLALYTLIVSQLDDAVKLALAAADQAHATATDKQNIAENKYDTLGLEAAYLAHGQSERVVALTQSIEDFKSLSQNNKPDCNIEIGSLISLEDIAGIERYLLIGPSAGGHKVTFEGMDITVITESSPLGQSLLTLQKGDEVTTQIAGKLIQYLITSVW